MGISANYLRVSGLFDTHVVYLPKVVYGERSTKQLENGLNALAIHNLGATRGCK